MNGFQREAQWKPDPFDTLTSDLLSSSSSSWHNTQSLTRGSSLRTPPSVPAPLFSSNTLPTSFSLQSSALSTLETSSSSSSSLSTPSPLTSSLLPPPPVPSRSRSQETLRASPNPLLTDPVPARPSSTNPFTGPLMQQQRRSITPDFSVQHPTARSDLQRTMSAFSQPLIPTPAPILAPAPAPTASAPSSQLQRTMSLLGPSSTLTPSPAPLLPSLAPVPALPLAPPSSIPAPIAPRRQPPPPGGKPAQQWVTFDDDSNFPLSTKTPAAPAFASASQPQTQPPHSAFDSDPNWASSSSSLFPSLPPPIPTRTAPNNPKLPDRPSDGFPFPKELTER